MNTTVILCDILYSQSIFFSTLTYRNIEYKNKSIFYTYWYVQNGKDILIENRRKMFFLIIEKRI